MSLFSSLSDLAGSFGGIFHESSEIGLSSRMGDSLFSSGSNQESSFGESVTSSTMSSSFDGSSSGSF